MAETEESEKTPAAVGLGRREYNVLLERFDKVDRFNVEILTLTQSTADRALEAHAIAKTALWMRSSWGPYLVSGLAFAMALAAFVSRQ